MTERSYLFQDLGIAVAGNAQSRLRYGPHGRTKLSSVLVEGHCMKCAIDSGREVRVVNIQGVDRALKCSDCVKNTDAP